MSSGGGSTATISPTFTFLRVVTPSQGGLRLLRLRLEFCPPTTTTLLPAPILFREFVKQWLCFIQERLRHGFPHAVAPAVVR